jgi:hypothetical protein
MSAERLSNHESHETKLASLESVGEIDGDEILKNSIIEGSDYNGEILTIEALKQLDLGPRYRVRMGDATVCFSQTYQPEKGRAAVAAYVEKDGKIFVRSYYRSNSQGVWRYLPDYDYHPASDGGVNMGRFGKGYNEESIALPIAIQKALSEISHGGDALETGDIDPWLVFAGTAIGGDVGGAFYREVDPQPQRLNGDFYDKPVKYNISPDIINTQVDNVREDAMQAEQLTRSAGLRSQVVHLKALEKAGELELSSRSNVEEMGDARNFDELHDVIDKMAGVPKLDTYFKTQPELINLNSEQSPDFSKLIDSWQQDTSLYGPITIEIFLSNDGELKFMFCKDEKGRAWIGGVENDSEIQSTGLRKSWIDGDDLMTPAYEYLHPSSDQTGGYGNENMKAGQYYVDMFKNYLSKIPVIQEYLRARPHKIDSPSDQADQETDGSMPDFNLATDFDQLYSILNAAGGLQGSDTFYTSEELIKKIEIVREGGDPQFITRSGGLREKVKELLKKEGSQ